MRLGVKVLILALLIAIVLVSGCQNLSLGSTQVADFGGEFGSCAADSGLLH